MKTKYVIFSNRLTGFGRASGAQNLIDAVNVPGRFGGIHYRFDDNRVGTADGVRANGI